MEKLKMHSLNKVESNIEKIAALFPNCITERINADGKIEHAIDFDVLKQELSTEIVEGLEERYQFTWPDKKKAILAANAPINKTLRPYREESVDFDNTENLYIEGDNLEVLKLLQETYLNKIKMIYIDPPYNTGNDFVYHDDFIQDTSEYLDNSGQFDENENRMVKNLETNGRFHTDWLNMMYPRLKLAKDLLTDDGVIVINIDEHEFINLQKILDEIFGELNNLGNIVWDKRNPKGDSKGIASQHEYILFYSKNKEYLLSRCQILRPKKNAELILKKAKQFFNKINLSYSFEQANKDFSQWINSQINFTGGEKAYNKFDNQGNVYQAVSMAWPNKSKAPEEYFIPLIHPITKKECPVPEKGWRNPRATMELLLENGLILFGEDENTQPRRKYLLKDNMFENVSSLLYYGGSDIELLKGLEIPFDTPKVLDICKEHILSFSNNDSIILDFFSGSATTAHAVIQLNVEDGGKRKFIMVQLPEATDEKSEAYKAGYKNICEIGKERIRRAGKKIKEENADKEGIENLDTGFRVLKIDSSNMKDVYYTPKEYTNEITDIFDLVDNVKEDRTDEDLLFQVMLDLGTELSSKIVRKEIAGKAVYDVAEGHIIACFADGLTNEIVTEIAKQKPSYFITRDSALENDSVAANYEQIFNKYSPATEKRVL